MISKTSNLFCYGFRDCLTRGEMTEKPSWLRDPRGNFLLTSISMQLLSLPRLVHEFFTIPLFLENHAPLV